MDTRAPLTSVVPGAQGKLLSVLLETSGELNLRTLARLAEVSVAQASRVMPQLVELGLVERREVPPSALFRVVPEHVAVRALAQLADARRTVLARIGEIVGAGPCPPVSAVVFGSFARGEAEAASDIDLLLVRPGDYAEDDEGWGSAVEAWRIEIRRTSGNRVEVLEATEAELAERIRSQSPLWSDIAAHGVVVFGAPLPVGHGSV